MSLVGLSGTGKSTVGALVAETLGWSFVDLDLSVEGAAGMSVERIFQERGEQAFRRLERVALEDALEKTDTVIATGGGAPCQSGAMDLMLQRSAVVWLRASTSALSERLRQDTPRPLLGTDEVLEQRLSRQLALRGDIYGQAPWQVDTDGRSPAQLAEQIVGLIQDPGGTT